MSADADARRARQNKQRRARRAANPVPHREDSRKWGAANAAYRRAQAAVYRHGPDIAAATAAMWAKQGGKCYLCGIYLVPDAGSYLVLDHDHRCCPEQKSCPYCRRGLACDKCNALIGMADDDPDLLRQIADALEVAKADVTARLAGKPEQLAIIPDGAR